MTGTPDSVSGTAAGGGADVAGGGSGGGVVDGGAGFGGSWASADRAGGRPGLAGLVRGLLSIVRIEDWLLAGFVVVAAPIVGARTSAGPFDGGQPLEGVLRLAAVLAALACVAARRADAAGDRTGRSFGTGTAAVGPFSGAILLVAISGGADLGLSSAAAPAFAVVALAAMLFARFVAPPLPAGVRRALMTPFVLVAGGLFWNVVDAVFGRPLVSGAPDVATLRALVTSPAFGFLVAFSAVYYAMLVYAPRQVAVAEGGAIAWAVRYALFLAAVTFGIGWLAAFAG